MPAIDFQSTDAHTPAPASDAISHSPSRAGWDLRSFPSQQSLQALLTATPLLAADVVAMLAAFSVAWFGVTMVSPADTLDWPLLAAGFTAAVVVASLAVGLYPGIGLGPITELRQITLATGYLGFTFTVVSMTENRTTLTLPLVIAGICLLLPFTMATGRTVARALCSRCNWWGQTVLIVGGQVPASLNYSFLRNNPRLGLRPLGIAEELIAADARGGPSAVANSLADTSALLYELGNPLLVVAMPRRARGELQRIVRSLSRDSSCRIILSDMEGSPGFWKRAGGCLDWPSKKPRSRISPLMRGLKRSVDFALSVAAGLLLLPLLGAIAALIKVHSPGPALYCQQRIGLHGERFMAWKFRTMICDADRVLEEYLASDPALRDEWQRDHKLQTDPRVTLIGRWLRKTSLDELPQLWNVVRGEMSLVGPRPIVSAEIAKYGEHFQTFCSVPPGITGLWQVSGRNNTTYAERVELDSYYARNWSPWLDIYILVSTIKVVVLRHGAY